MGAGTVVELPSECEKPDKVGLVKKDKAEKMRASEGMFKGKPQPEILELPPQGWATEYIENKTKQDKKQAAQERKSMRDERKRKSLMARGKSVNQAASSDTSDVARLRATSDTSGRPLTPVNEDGEEEEEEDLGGVAAEFEFQWDELGLGASTWQKSKLRAVGDALKDEPTSKLTLPQQLLGSKSNMKKMLADPGRAASPPSRAASRAASRASRARAIDDGKVNFALGWTTRAIASRASSRASNRAIANKPAGATQTRRVDSPLVQVANSIV